jgi:hypothetical protein
MIRSLVPSLLPLLLLGCSTSLVSAQRQALDARYGSTSGGVSYVPSERCETLSDRHTLWGGIAKGAAIGAGASGVASLPVQELPEDKRGTATYTAAGVMVGLAILAGSAVYVEQDSAAAFARECAP